MLKLTGFLVAAAFAAAAERDILVYYSAAAKARGAGLARKSKPVDARPAKEGEIVVTLIKGEGVETRSPPAKAGDRVVRNRCPETGNEEILVKAYKFAERYDGPAATGADGWAEYRPRGVDMNFIIVPPREKPFRFKAPWGEAMVAKPGDIIVQDPANPKDTYRIAKAAFVCTYEILREPAR